MEENKNELLKTLSLDIKYAEKYGLDASLVEESIEEKHKSTLPKHI